MGDGEDWEGGGVVGDVDDDDDETNHDDEDKNDKNNDNTDNKRERKYIKREKYVKRKKEKIQNRDKTKRKKNSAKKCQGKWEEMSLAYYPRSPPLIFGWKTEIFINDIMKCERGYGSLFFSLIWKKGQLWKKYYVLVVNITLLQNQCKKGRPIECCNSGIKVCYGCSQE